MLAKQQHHPNAGIWNRLRGGGAQPAASELFDATTAPTLILKQDDQVISGNSTEMWDRNVESTPDSLELPSKSQKMWGIRGRCDRTILTVVLKMMNFVFQKMSFALKMLNSALKLMNFVFRSGRTTSRLRRT